MAGRMVSGLVVAALVWAQCASVPAFAENRMGYRLLSNQEASSLPQRGGAIGVAVAPAQEINESGLRFEVLRVSAVKQGSPGARAGLRSGDMIIAADGRVFPGVAAFGSYVGSVQQGEALSLDYIPARGGPKDAQRVAVVVGTGTQQRPAAQEEAPQPKGLSTGTKIAIGIGAAALFGCYKFGCFSRGKTQSGARPNPAGAQR